MVDWIVLTFQLCSIVERVNVKRTVTRATKLDVSRKHTIRRQVLKEKETVRNTLKVLSDDFLNKVSLTADAWLSKLYKECIVVNYH